MTTVNPNSYQVGGDHYKEGSEGGMQHWDLMYFLYGESYFRANASKYLERFRRKNGLQDLLKAAQYVHKLVFLLRQDGNISPVPASIHNLEQVKRFISIRERTAKEKAILFDIFYASSIEHLEELQVAIEKLADSEYPEIGSEVTPAYVAQGAQ